MSPLDRQRSSEIDSVKDKVNAVGWSSEITWKWQRNCRQGQRCRLVVTAHLKLTALWTRLRSLRVVVRTHVNWQLYRQSQRHRLVVNAHLLNAIDWLSAFMWNWQSCEERGSASPFCGRNSPKTHNVNQRLSERKYRLLDRSDMQFTSKRKVLRQMTGEHWTQIIPPPPFVVVYFYTTNNGVLFIRKGMMYYFRSTFTPTLMFDYPFTK